MACSLARGRGSTGFTDGRCLLGGNGSSDADLRIESASSGTDSWTGTVFAGIDGLRVAIATGSVAESSIAEIFAADASSTEVINSMAASVRMTAGFTAAVDIEAGTGK